MPGHDSEFQPRDRSGRYAGFFAYLSDRAAEDYDYSLTVLKKTVGEAPVGEAVRQLERQLSTGPIDEVAPDGKRPAESTEDIRVHRLIAREAAVEAARRVLFWAKEAGCDDQIVLQWERSGGREEAVTPHRQVRGHRE